MTTYFVALVETLISYKNLISLCSFLTFNPDVTYFSPETVLTRSPPFILRWLNIAAATVASPCVCPPSPPSPWGTKS